MLWGGFDVQTFSVKFQKEMCYKVTVPYLIGSANDLRFPKTTGGARAILFILPLLDKFFSRMLYVGSKNKYVHQNFLHIVNMTEWKILFP